MFLVIHIKGTGVVPHRQGATTFSQCQSFFGSFKSLFIFFLFIKTGAEAGVEPMGIWVGFYLFADEGNGLWVEALFDEVTNLFVVVIHPIIVAREKVVVKLKSGTYIGLC